MNYTEVNLNDQESLKLLKKYHTEVLQKVFDEDELETCDQLLDTLEKFSRGDFGLNSYHIIIITEKDLILGGIIYDYYIDTNTGLVEYIATNPDCNQKGIGSYTFKIANSLLNEEAIKNGFSGIDFITCEVEKIINEKKSNHYFWETFGFRKLDFNYIQPPLDSDKNAVEIMNFGIITKAPLSPYTDEYLDKERLKSILHDYLHYTMRIEDVDNCIYYTDMCKEINNKEKIKLI